MYTKPYKLGLIIGRFQTFHIGHELMINTALKLCDRVVVFVGSAQESGTLKNPFTYEYREEILKKVFDSKIEIYPLRDIGVGNNNKWGEYVLNKVVEKTGLAPDVLISGKEGRRLDWFDNIEEFAIAEHYIPKTIYISATNMREHLINDNQDLWREYTSEALWDCYEQFRTTVLSCKDNNYTKSI